MKCKHVQQKMLDYTEHVLDSPAYEQVKHHLQACPECTQELEAIQGTLDLLTSTPIEEPPESFWTDFTSDVMRKVRTAKPPVANRQLFSSWQIRLVMACVLLLIITGIYAYWSIRNHPQVMTTQTLPGDVDTPPLDTALRQIIPEELPQRMLETEFALFDDIGSPALEIYSSNMELDGLLSSLSAEEKRELLLELYKMRERSQ